MEDVLVFFQRFLNDCKGSIIPEEQGEYVYDTFLKVLKHTNSKTSIKKFLNALEGNVNTNVMNHIANRFKKECRSSLRNVQTSFDMGLVNGIESLKEYVKTVRDALKGTLELRWDELIQNCLGVLGDNERNIGSYFKSLFVTGYYVPDYWKYIYESLDLMISPYTPKAADTIDFAGEGYFSSSFDALYDLENRFNKSDLSLMKKFIPIAKRFYSLYSFDEEEIKVPVNNSSLSIIKARITSVLIGVRDLLNDSAINIDSLKQTDDFAEGLKIITETLNEYTNVFLDNWYNFLRSLLATRIIKPDKANEFLERTDLRKVSDDMKAIINILKERYGNPEERKFLEKLLSDMEYKNICTILSNLISFVRSHSYSLDEFMHRILFAQGKGIDQNRDYERLISVVYDFLAIANPWISVTIVEDGEDKITPSIINGLRDLLISYCKGRIASDNYQDVLCIPLILDLI